MNFVIESIEPRVGDSFAHPVSYLHTHFGENIHDETNGGDVQLFSCNMYPQKRYELVYLSSLTNLNITIKL